MHRKARNALQTPAARSTVAITVPLFCRKKYITVTVQFCDASTQRRNGCYIHTIVNGKRVVRFELQTEPIC
jgi:hypothetical protein